MQKAIEVVYEKGVFKPLTPMEKEIPEKDFRKNNKVMVIKIKMHKK